MSEQDDLGLDISSGLIRHTNGTFGVWVRVVVTGRDDIEPVREVLAAESGGPACFPTERDAEIAAFDWIEDIRRDAISDPQSGLRWASEGEIERSDGR